jgi:hypothetical protein
MHHATAHHQSYPQRQRKVASSSIPQIWSATCVRSATMCQSHLELVRQRRPSAASRIYRATADVARMPECPQGGAQPFVQRPGLRHT